MFQALGLTVRDTLRDTGRIFMGLWQQPGFYKFLAFLSFAAFIKMIFLHMDYTYPKFGIRELGEGAPIGHLYALNSILIVFLAPLVGRADPEDSRLPHGHLRELRRRLLGLHHDDPAAAVPAAGRRLGGARHRQFLAGRLLAVFTRRLPRPAGVRQ